MSEPDPKPAKPKYKCPACQKPTDFKWACEACQAKTDNTDPADQDYGRIHDPVEYL